MKRLFTTIAAAAMLFTGCQNEEPQAINSGDGEVTFTSGIATRASDTMWMPNDKIGVYMLETGTTTAIKSHVEYTNSANDATVLFTTTTPIYYPHAGHVDFLAYYPYASPALIDYKYLLNVKDQINLPAIDLMTSKNLTNVARSTEAKNLIFNHKLSNIALVIKVGDGLMGQDLTGLTVQLTGTKATGTYDISAADADADVIVLTGTSTAITLQTAANGTSAKGIVIPQTWNNGTVKLVFALKDVLNAVATIAATQFEKNKKQTYTVTLHRTEATLSAGTITPWGSGSDEILDAKPE